MESKKLTLESLEARYAGFCAAMHGVQDTLHYDASGVIFKASAHE